MKWLAIMLCLILIGCVTEEKRHIRHHSRQPKKKQVAQSDDDVAMKALIKSLREE